MYVCVFLFTYQGDRPVYDPYALIESKLRPFLKTKRYHPDTLAVQSQMTKANRSFLLQHIELNELKQLAGFGDVNLTQLWELHLEVLMRRMLVAQGARKPRLVTGLIFELETHGTDPVRCQTMIDPDWLAWCGSQTNRASLEEVLAEIVAREPGHFLCGMDDVEDPWTWLQTSGELVLRPSHRIEGRDPITGAVLLRVPVVKPGSLQVVPQQHNLGDVADNPWIKVLEERYQKDKARYSTKYAKIEASDRYQKQWDLINNPQYWVQTLPRQNKEANLYQGCSKRDGADPRVQSIRQYNRDWYRQNLKINTLFRWTGLGARKGHGTRELREPLQELWSRIRDPNYFDTPRVLADDFFDVERRRYLLHRVYHVPFVVTLMSGLKVEGALSLHPSSLDCLFVTLKESWAIQTKVAIWVAKMSVAELHYVFPQHFAILGESTMELFREQLSPSTLKLYFGPWPLEVDPYPLNVWSDILWQRLEAHMHCITGKKDMDLNMVQTHRQRRSREKIVVAEIPKDRTKRATVGVPTTLKAPPVRPGWVEDYTVIWEVDQVSESDTEEEEEEEFRDDSDDFDVAETWSEYNLQQGIILTVTTPLVPTPTPSVLTPPTLPPISLKCV